MDDFVYEKPKPVKKIPLPTEFRPESAAQLLIDFNSSHPTKRMPNANKEVLGPKFFLNTSDPYISSALRSQFMGQDLNQTDSGVQKVDEFTQVHLADHLDKIRLTHMSNNRNFNSYANFLSLKSSDIVFIFESLTAEFLNFLLSISKQHRSTGLSPKKQATRQRLAQTASSPTRNPKPQTNQPETKPPLPFPPPLSFPPLHPYPLPAPTHPTLPSLPHPHRCRPGFQHFHSSCLLDRLCSSCCCPLACCCC